MKTNQVRSRNYAGIKGILLAFPLFCFIIAGTQAQNIGAGTLIPLMKMHVATADSSVLLIENTQLLDANMSTGLYFKAGNGYTGAVKTIGQNASEARLGLFTYASEETGGLIERVSILDNGNVGINTINPGSKLEVTGDVKITGRISNVNDPTDAQDVATKAYVDLLEVMVDSLQAHIDSLQAQVLELQDDTEYITDIDNNTYKIVTIGNQIWMAENLQAIRYNDGTPIPWVHLGANWANLTTPAYVAMNNEPTEYGLLYNFYVVADTNSRNICPAGWHVPDHDEWDTLMVYLGGENVAGGKMKSTGFTHWRAPNVGATNSSGFSGLPGGSRMGNGAFQGATVVSQFWQSTEVNSTDAWATWLDAYYPYAYVVSHALKKEGNSIRCIKD